MAVDVVMTQLMFLKKQSLSVFGHFCLVMSVGAKLTTNNGA